MIYRGYVHAEGVTERFNRPGRNFNRADTRPVIVDVRGAL